MRYVRTTAPATAPITAPELKAQAIIQHGDDDGLVDRYIAAATDHLDGRRGILGQALVTQSWTASCRAPAGRCFHLDPPPVASIASVKYFDAANVQQTVDPANYRLEFDHINRASVVFVSGYGAPSFYDRSDAWQVVFTTGYGAAADVPESIRHAIALLAAHWYKYREAATDVAAHDLPFAVAALLVPYRTAIR